MHRMRHLMQWILAGTGLALLAACAPTPTQHPSSPALPAQWSTYAQDEPGGSVTGDARQDWVSIEWWRRFGSAELDRLVAQARQQSQDIAAAAARVHQAQASARIAGAMLLPDISASLEAGRQARLGEHAIVDGSLYAAGVGASYEVDFWGRNRAYSESAFSTLTATRYDLDTVRLTVTAGTASAWLQAVSLTERAGIAEDSLRSAQDLLALVRSQFQSGAATALAVAQQGALTADRQRTLAALHQQADQARIALAQLLGEPRDVTVKTLTLAAIRKPVIDVGVPSDLLQRRPDIARAEAQLAAAGADVQAARAAMFPSLVLTATVGVSGDKPGRVFDNPLYSLAAGLAAPIFNAGRLAAGHEQAQARHTELLADYRQAIVIAFSDVQTALATLRGLQAQQDAQAQMLAQADLGLRLASSRYRAGAETLLVVLDAQRTLYDARDLAATLQAQRLQSAVALFRALGGGWTADEARPCVYESAPTDTSASRTARSPASESGACGSSGSPTS